MSINFKNFTKDEEKRKGDRVYTLNEKAWNQSITQKAQ